MALYANTVLTPLNTPETNPVIREFTINEPVIIGWEIYFPPGCAGLCYAGILIDGVQFAPAAGSLDRYHHGEGAITWTGRKLTQKGTSQTTITIRTYNLDDTYDHSPIIRMSTEDEGK